MKVHWTDNAISHLVDIYEYIAHSSPMYAKRMVDKITRRSEQIVDFPRSGRIVPEYKVNDMREMVEKPYRIIYRIKPEQIDVLTVIHCVQLLPEEL